MSQNILNICKILILLYHWIWHIWYKLYPADTINIHHTSFSTLRPRLTKIPKHLHVWFLHLYTSVLSKLCFFKWTFMTVSPWPSRTYTLLLWPLLFSEWCSGRLVMRMSTSQLLVIIGGFDRLLHVLPSNLARWFSPILTSRSYHTCVYLLLFIGSFIVLYSCMMCYNCAHPINLFLVVIVLHYVLQCIITCIT